MSFFSRKNKKNKEEEKMTTWEDVKKAYEDLSEDGKKSFHQSFKDRVDESVGEQEHLQGDRDSQTAKDRVDEAEGAERADEKREEVHEEAQDAKSADHSEDIRGLKEEIAALRADIAALKRDPQPAAKDTGDQLDKLVSKYSN